MNQRFFFIESRASQVGLQKQKRYFVSKEAKSKLTA